MNQKLQGMFRKVRMPKRNRKLFDVIEEVEGVLDYYMGRDKSRELRQKLEGVKKAIEELSVEQKQHDIRLIKRLKARERLKNEHKDQRQRCNEGGSSEDSE